MSARIDREAVGRELLDLLDQIEAEEEHGRELSKKSKERVGELRAQARERRDILAGKRGVQLPLVARVLNAAAKVASRKEPEDRECPACGVDSDQPSPGCEECSHPEPLDPDTMCACGTRVGDPMPSCEHHRQRHRASVGKVTKVHRTRKKKRGGPCAGCGNPAECWVLGEVRCFRCATIAKNEWKRDHPDDDTPREEAL